MCFFKKTPQLPQNQHKGHPTSTRDFGTESPLHHWCFSPAKHRPTVQWYSGEAACRTGFDGMMRNLAEEFLFRIQKPTGNHYGKTHFLYRPVVVIAQFVTKWNYNNYIYQILHRPTSGRGLTKNGWCISVLDQTSWFWKTRTCALWRQCGWATDNLKWHRDLNHLSFYELRKHLHLMENIFQRKIRWSHQSHPVSSCEVR